MKGGLGDGIGDTRGDGVNKGRINIAEAVNISLCPRNCFFKDGSLGRIFHVIDILVYLGRLNTLKVIPNGHIKDKTVSISQTKLLGKNMADNPCLDILIKCLRNR